MLLLVLWKIGFEFVNIGWLFGGRRATVKYFAYGANLDKKVLEKRRITPLLECDFVLRDHKLNFSRSGLVRNSGFASADYRLGDKIFGKLYTIRSWDLIRMDYYELVRFIGFYRRISWQQDGEKFYFYQTTDFRDGLLPTQEYKRKILKGYSSAPTWAVHELENIKTVEDDKALAGGIFIRDTDRFPSFIQPIISKADLLISRFFKTWFYRFSVTDYLVERIYRQQAHQK